MSPTPSPSSRSQFLDFGLREGPAVPSTAVEGRESENDIASSYKYFVALTFFLSRVDETFYDGRVNGGK